MSQSLASPARIRVGATALALAGVLFVLYPALRPFSDETSMDGAAAFASSLWIGAHVFAIFGFILTALGSAALWLALGETRTEPLALRGAALIALGVALALPFYGAEAFALHAIGQAAMRENSTTILDISADVRGGVGLVIFLAGLTVLAVGAIIVAIAIWHSQLMSRWSGIPFALGLATYIPQFFGAQPIRVAHGVLVAIGCVWIASGMWRSAGDKLGSDRGFR
jgi:hypothetical protein